jgi:uncharacterized membrane protein YphA (DoxX/SURF4 family)
MMNAILRHHWVFALLRAALGVVFIWAGILKFQGAQAFADSIATFRLLPAELINLLALALPPLEIATGLICIFGRPRRLGTFSALVLCTVFASALTSALVRGIEVDCGCFGSSGSSVTKMWFSLGRALTLGVVAGVLYRIELRGEKDQEAALENARGTPQRVPLG